MQCRSALPASLTSLDVEARALDVHIILLEAFYICLEISARKQRSDSADVFLPKLHGALPPPMWLILDEVHVALECVARQTPARSQYLTGRLLNYGLQRLVNAIALPVTLHRAKYGHGAPRASPERAQQGHP